MNDLFAPKRQFRAKYFFENDFAPREMQIHASSRDEAHNIFHQGILLERGKRVQKLKHFEIHQIVWGEE